jgi:hypothetical protein
MDKINIIKAAIDTIVIPVLCIVVMLFKKVLYEMLDKSLVFLLLPSFVFFIFSFVKCIIIITNKRSSFELRLLAIIGFLLCGIYYYLCFSRS